MELLSNSALGDSDDSMTWQFEDDAVINGNGNHFDLQHGVLKIKSGKTLELRDMVIDNLVTASFLDDSSYAGTLKLSNVTVILQSSVNWAAVDGNLTIDGPTTFITGASKFTPPTTGGTSTINGVTVWYDTLGQPDSGNISGNDFGGTGRVSSLDSSVASLEFTSSANEIAQSYHLTPVDYATDADGAQNTSGTVGGVQAAFTGGDTFVFDGHGRTLYLADVTNTANASSDKGLIKVSGDTTVKSAHVTIDGFQEAAITRNAATDFFNFDVGTVLRLQSDQALTTSYSFGNDSNIDRDSGTYTVIVDLNGHTLNLADAGAELRFQDESGLNVLFKNGRLLDVSGTKLNSLLASDHSETGSADSTVTFEDVEMVLAADTTLSSSDYTFLGNCSIKGTHTDGAEYTVTAYHSNLTIGAGAMLTLDRNIVLAVADGSGTAQAKISFAAPDSTLNMVGSKLDASSLTDGLTGDEALTTGTIRVDHKVVFAGDMTLGSTTSGQDLDIDLMPGAGIEVTSGTVTYANAS